MKPIRGSNVPPATRPGGQRGFTLIEVMVVVAIIGVMAAVVGTKFGFTMRKRWSLKQSSSELANTLVSVSTRARTAGQMTFLSFATNCGGGANPFPFDKAYIYSRGAADAGTACAELPGDIYFVGSAAPGPPAPGGAVHAAQPGGYAPAFAAPARIQFNPQGFSTTVLNVANDTIYLALLDRATGAIDPMYVRAVVLRNIGQPQVWEQSASDQSWRLVTGD